MRVIEVDNYDEMSEKAAELILEKIKENKHANLGLATGGTPVGTYRCLIKDHTENKTSYKNVQTFNLDEYIGIDPDNPNSYHSYMKANLFDHIDIPAAQTHIPNGNAEDLAIECLRYDKMIEEKGGIDLQLLGIGTNGHIGFNEPGTPFASHTHVVELAQSTREANARYFNSLDEVPTHALTMGISSILASKGIVLLASGEMKADAIYELLYGKIDEEMPASALRKHSNVTLIADKDALKKVKGQRSVACGQ
ncbi:glucosamine-6-phosphate deaminase [Pseudalkalibacillus caeni]|uniref:Glucosamine-6-phosphate deaminase n=1 Tax=Exobacillus caeni TaxID=2574798 RepID=A0A5R9F8W8_9BACL|nr:glucosamine-6-phosphate deaminase [Pseudalkalibacillus caeni]TLS38766.1 glucosamine-6-phosphate deaminase [Pseudalkalibacillus caeni]